MVGQGDLCICGKQSQQFVDIPVVFADVAGVAFFTGLAAGGEFALGFDLEGDEVFLIQHTEPVDDAPAAEEEGVVIVIEQNG